MEPEKRFWIAVTISTLVIFLSVSCTDGKRFRLPSPEDRGDHPVVIEDPFSSEDGVEEDEERSYPYPYLMVDKKKKKIVETEEEVLHKAFELHMKDTPFHRHDVYAYKLPSSLWFVVRYIKNEETGQTQRFMNIVDSYLNYLEKLGKGVRSVSINVKGVETVFSFRVKD